MTERITLAESLPTTAVVRVSRASYDPSRFAEVDAASKKTSQYIIPAIRRLPGSFTFMRASRRGARSCKSVSGTATRMRHSWTG